MWAHGLKRKLDQDGEEEDGGATPPPRPSPPPPPPPPPYGLQRQLVLNMSLLKLYGSPGSGGVGADLGLQRRVLINNVVRRIHDDFRREGEAGFGPALFFSTAAAAPPTMDDAFSCLTPASLLEDDLPVFFTLPLSPSSPSPAHSQLLPQGLPRPPPTSPSANDSFSSALEEIEELCPPPPPPPPSPPPPPPPSAAARLVFDVVMKEERRSQQATPPAPPPALAPPPPPSTSFLTDFALDDALFTDIDTSMYDLCPPGLPPSPFPPLPPGAPPSKLTAEDLVRSVSGFGPVGAGPQNQPLRMDLTELDHIMEVLVGS
ncbi:SERTA domain-containing protein 2-like [Nelusetta ayraudi]|uniref:SERTA domain-containing protein 2-like n=1 Tax=Nelusetta ayraudi TaxID=303726 RepID=UPI003F6EFE7F